MRIWYPQSRYYYWGNKSCNRLSQSINILATIWSRSIGRPVIYLQKITNTSATKPVEVSSQFLKRQIILGPYHRDSEFIYLDTLVRPVLIYEWIKFIWCISGQYLELKPVHRILQPREYVDQFRNSGNLYNLSKTNSVTPRHIFIKANIQWDKKMHNLGFNTWYSRVCELQQYGCWVQIHLTWNLTCRGGNVQDVMAQQFE